MSRVLSMKSIPSVCALLIAGVVMVSLTGCAASDATTAPNPPANSSDAPENDPSEPAAEPGETDEPNDATSGSGPSAGLENLGSVLQDTLGGIDDYEVDGSVVRLYLDASVMSAFDQEVVCSQARQLAASVTLPEGASAEAVLNGEALDCDI